MNGVRNKVSGIIPVTVFFCATAAVAQVDIHGTVSDSIGNPVKGAIVLITGIDKKDTADANGAYTIQEPPVSTAPPVDRQPKRFQAVLVKGALRVFVPEYDVVSIKLFTITGRQLFSTASAGIGTGWQTIMKTNNQFAKNPLLVCLETKSGGRTVKTIYGENVSGSIDISNNNKISAKTAVLTDTINVTCRMYKRAFRAIVSYTGTQNFVLKQCPPASRLAGMKYLSRDTFSMGRKGLFYDPGPSGLAEPVHTVTLSAFYIDSTEVTQADYENVMKVNPTFNPGHPLYAVDGTTWFDAALYCNARSKKDGFDTVYSYTSITGTPGNACSNLAGCVIHYDRAGYRLPTEAEWEYACRGKTTTDVYWGNAPDSEYIWASNNAGGHTNEVAKKKPNLFHLYDMSGNCWEWCNDYDSVYTSGAQFDPVGPRTGTTVQLRGAAWHEPYGDIRFYSACRHGEMRNGHFNNAGFRVVFQER